MRARICEGQGSRRLPGRLGSFVRWMMPSSSLQEPQLCSSEMFDIYNMGAIPTKKSLLKCENLSVSTFCRSPGEVYKRAGEMVGSQLE
ncbi:unnamed protein product [Urochloa humidicola]